MAAPAPFPDPPYAANRMMIASTAMAVVGIIVAWLFLPADLMRMRLGLPPEPLHLTIGLGGVLIAAVCAYGAVEHFLDRAQEGIHEARAWMAWSVMLAVLGPAVIFTALLDFPIPYPSASQAISGRISEFSVSRQPSSVTLHVRLTSGPSYSYVCSYSGRTGWCERHDALIAAAAMTPHSATLLPLNNQLLMLRLDGVTVIDWADERSHRMYIGVVSLLFGAALLLFGIYRFRAALTWAQRTRMA